LSDLFVNAHFFADLDDYIVISTTATTTSEKITWNKAVHSKVVKLASSVEIRDGTPRQNTANNILHGNYQWANYKDVHQCRVKGKPHKHWFECSHRCIL